MQLAFLGALLLAVAAAFAIRFGTPAWLTNDDPTMSWLASGAFTGDPTSRLVFVSSVIGMPLTWLYRVSPAVSWYALALVATFVLSWSVLLVLVTSLRSRVGWLVVALPSTIWFALRPNFTIVAFLATAVGLGMYASSIRAGRFGWLGLGVATVGVLWRPQAGLLTLVALSPLLVYALLDRRPRTRWSSAAVLVVAPLAIALVASRLGNVCLGDASCGTWSDFLTFTSLKSSLQTGPRGEVMAMIGPIADWTSAQLNTFMNFAFPDDPMFGVDRVAALNSSFPMYFRLLGPDISSHLSALYGFVSPYMPMLLAGLLAFPIAGALRSSRPWSLLLRALVVTATTAAAVLVTSLVRVTEANALGATLALVVAWITLAAWASSSDAPGAGKVRVLVSWGATAIAAVFAILWLTVGSVSVPTLQEKATAWQARAQVFQTRYREVARDAVVFGQGNVADYLSSGPYSDDRAVVQAGPLLSGWTVFSAAFEARRMNSGFESVYGDLRAGQTAAGKPALFIGSATNAQLTATVLNETSDGPDVAAEQVGAVTLPDDPSIGEIALWRFVPIS